MRDSSEALSTLRPTLHRRVTAALAAVFAVVAASAQPGPAAARDHQVTFTDLALPAGFQDLLGHGRALIAADFNNDGWVDFYVGNPGDPVFFPDESFILWSNGPDREGRFTFTKGQVLLKGEIAFDACAWDYDNDGDRDLFIGVGGQEGIGLDYLFRNDDGFFTDVSEEARVRGPKAPDGRSVPVATSSGFPADYDQDGDLDLFVAVRNHRKTLVLPGGLGSRDSLFRNDGDGTFTDVTVAAGLADPVGATAGRGAMTATWGDFDNDGWMDLYVPLHSPQVDVRFFRNNHDGTFSDVGIRGVHVDLGSQAAWSSSVADFNNDGLLDVIVFARRLISQDWRDTHALLINRGDWSFTNEKEVAGFTRERVPATMGTALGDFDNDGWQDLFTGNGGPLFGEANNLYRNRGAAFDGLSFLNVSSLIDYPAQPDPDCVAPVLPSKGSLPTWVHSSDMLPAAPGEPGAVDTSTLPDTVIDPCDPPYPYRGHGAMFVDFDKDGDLDLLMADGGTTIIAPEVVSNAPNRLYRNDGGNRKNWLALELEGTLSNRDAIGSTVELVATRGGGERRTIFNHWQGYTGFSANAPEELHFGLGDHDAIERIRIAWPSGAVTVLDEVAVNQRVAVDETFFFADDFNAGSGAEWRVLAGSWEVQHGAYGKAGAGSGMTVRDGGALADFELVAKASYHGGQRRIGVLGRVSADGRSHYAAILGDGRAQIYKSVEGRLTALGSPVRIAPMTVGRSYIVHMEFRGSRIGMSVDRSAPVVVEDGDIPAGTIGLVAVGARAAFDNVGVY